MSAKRFEEWWESNLEPSNFFDVPDDSDTYIYAQAAFTAGMEAAQEINATKDALVDDRDRLIREVANIEKALRSLFIKGAAYEEEIASLRVQLKAAQEGCSTKGREWE